MDRSEMSPTPTPALAEWPEAEVPRSIGPYKIVRLLGQGGMGVVYLADQSKPVRRRVALKIIRPGMDSRNVIARFESERQALAMMDHPGVARVLGAGSTEQGVPYFVMEYVRGLPLLVACDRLRLTTRERLDLFIQICRAVQHAHQKGILHRDLKPSNVMVYLDEGKPVPKVIDFGLAKATDHKLTEKTLLTRFGLLVGTPTYMSPEQAGHRDLDIDTRSDVYSLGVLLYRLLVSAPPFNLLPYVQRGALEEMRRIICEEIPPLPSAMVRLQGRSASKKVAASRRTNPSTLTRQIRGDLDAITMRSLEKIRSRRYGAAIELAADIQRYLQHEPVHAGPPRASYRFKKFLRKHRVVSTLVFVLMLVLSSGVVISTRFYLEASRRARDAERLNREARGFRDRLDKSHAKEQKTARVALENEKRAVASAERADEQERKLEEILHSAAEVDVRERLLVEDRRRLADLDLLSTLNRDAERVGAPTPEGISTMRDWVARARVLMSRLSGYEMSLEAFDEGRAPSTDEASLEGVESRIGGAESDDFHWRCETLLRLVDGLRRFGSLDLAIGTMTRVEVRLAAATARGGKTEDEVAELWRWAIASIRNPLECPEYEGLEILEQAGLIPIGRNRDSGLWEFGHPMTGELPEVDEDGVVPSDGMGLVFVLVPEGTVVIGARQPSEEQPEGDPYVDLLAERNEAPLDVITLAPFFLSKYEMTQFQWRRLTFTEPSLIRSGRDLGVTNQQGDPVVALHPVEMVSWRDAEAALGLIGIELPTESQWEYAARAGATTIWWTGNDPKSLDGAANLADAFRSRCLFGEEASGSEGEQASLPAGDGYLYHAPVGCFSANRFGFHDVHGNVAELCRDAFGGYLLPTTPREGQRCVPKSTVFRVARGGSFAEAPVGLRVSRRMRVSKDFRSSEIGLRPSRALSE